LSPTVAPTPGGVDPRFESKPKHPLTDFN